MATFGCYNKRMAKGGTTITKNFLRISGIFFGFIGLYHILRSQGISLHFIEFTRQGSLVYGILVLILSVACFMASRK